MSVQHKKCLFIFLTSSNVSSMTNYPTRRSQFYLLVICYVLIFYTLSFSIQFSFSGFILFLMFFDFRSILEWQVHWMKKLRPQFLLPPLNFPTFFWINRMSSQLFESICRLRILPLKTLQRLWPNDKLCGWHPYASFI